MNVMPHANLIPFLGDGSTDRSVIFGAPSDFDFLKTLGTANEIRIAAAFGHMSGWKEIEDALLRSSAQRVRLLLGQAFFQTEPELLLRLKNLGKRSQPPRFEVKLASAVATFHPKVWIIDHAKFPIGIVGSANLSLGGLRGNVECGLFTKQTDHVAALEEWFDETWALRPPLEEILNQYISNYQKTEAARKFATAAIEAATREEIDKEATWHRRRAITLASKYWESGEGIHTVSEREAAIGRMRENLDYPRFNFSPADWSTFLRIPELGRIRLGHEKQTLAELSKLKVTLTTITTEKVAVDQAVEILQE